MIHSLGMAGKYLHGQGWRRGSMGSGAGERRGARLTRVVARWRGKANSSDVGGVRTGNFPGRCIGWNIFHIQSLRSIAHHWQRATAGRAWRERVPSPSRRRCPAVTGRQSACKEQCSHGVRRRGSRAVKLLKGLIVGMGVTNQERGTFREGVGGGTLTGGVGSESAVTQNTSGAGGSGQVVAVVSAGGCMHVTSVSKGAGVSAVSKRQR